MQNLPLQTLLCIAMGLGLSLSASAADPLKVGFVYIGPIGDHGWTYQHEQGRKALAEKLGSQITTNYVENVAEGADAERVIRNMAKDNYDLIFTTSFGYMNPTVKVAKQFPKVTFEHATGYKQDKNLGTYLARTYEGRYVGGFLAAKMTKSKKNRLRRLVPDPRSDPRHQRHSTGLEQVQPRHRNQSGVGQLVVRPGQRGRRGQRAD